MSIKGHRDQIGRDFWRETFGERPLERHTSGLGHTFAGFFSGKYSLVSVKHLM